ncbi:outer membrane beta-barrel protein [Ekhidna sp.]
MMKYFTLLLIVFLISIKTSAQIQEGAKVIDLSFSFSDSESPGSSTFFFGQSLIGFATSENTLFYGGLRYESLNFSSTGNEVNEHLTSFVVGYEKLFELNEKVYFSPFITTSYGFGKIENPSVTSDMNQFTFSIQPRLHYFINNKWSVVASVGIVQYISEKEKSGGGELTRKRIGANLNAANTSFGIRLNLNNE